MTRIARIFSVSSRIRCQFRLDGRPFRQQRGVDYRFNQAADGLGIGVMRAQLTTLVGVEIALE